MGRLDPGLQLQLGQRADAPPPTGGELMIELEANPEAQPAEARVLVHFNGSIDNLVAAGLKPTSVAGNVAAGSVPRDRLEQLAALESVLVVEGSRPLMDELNESLIEIGASQLHQAVPARGGAGVIVGLIDSGIDYTHGCFRKENGDTRILAIWDQNLSPSPEEKSPAGFRYGVEYTREMIDAALPSGAQAFDKVRHQDRGHGTLVAGIAAGNGLPPGIASGYNVELHEQDIAENKPGGTYVGVAPAADILVVALNNDGPIGGSACALDGVSYLLQKAEELRRPIVINISQGDYLGPHDGTSPLECAIDHLIGKPGQAIVKAAGNAQASKTHASGALRADHAQALTFNVKEGDRTPDIIDIWYAADDRFDVSIQQPDGQVSNRISPGPCAVSLVMPNQNQVDLDSSTFYPVTGDNRIYLQLKPGSGQFIEPGQWTILLQATTLKSGRFDAWINRSNDPVPEFTGPLVNDRCTVSIPGTSAKIITVGAYIIRMQFDPGDAVSKKASKNMIGHLAPYSSLGPTRDGRQKPELAAPGETIISARKGAHGNKQYFLMGGTSMSAPHVTGAIALLLEQNPNLTQEQIKVLLCQHARSDSATSSPSGGWGAGRLNVLSAYNALLP